MAASRARSRLTQETIILLLLVAASLLPASAQLTQEAGGAVDHVESSKENASLRTQLIHGIHSESVNEEDGSTRDDEWVVDANSDLGSAGGLLDALFASFSMILVSEIGDETFIIAALLAMRHPRSIVLSGALSALIIMTVLSTGLGRIVPNLISRKHTNSAATVLYTFFGLRLLYIAWRSSSKNTQQKELEEVEEKLEVSPQGKTIWRRVLSRFCTPIFLEVLLSAIRSSPVRVWSTRQTMSSAAVLVLFRSHCSCGCSSSNCFFCCCVIALIDGLCGEFQVLPGVLVGYPCGNGVQQIKAARSCFTLWLLRALAVAQHSFILMGAGHFSPPTELYDVS